TVPLSCAAALKGRSDAANSHRAARGAILRQGAPLGAFIIVMLAPIESAVPLGARADSRQRHAPVAAGKPRDSSRQAR
ncbi:MAG TPA: hypothetical protein VI010_10900, partial [Xanthobacteraceae bacterium]